MSLSTVFGRRRTPGPVQPLGELSRSSAIRGRVGASPRPSRANRFWIERIPPDPRLVRAPAANRLCNWLGSWPAPRRYRAPSRYPRNSDSEFVASDPARARWDWRSCSLFRMQIGKQPRQIVSPASRTTCRVPFGVRAVGLRFRRRRSRRPDGRVPGLVERPRRTR